MLAGVMVDVVQLIHEFRHVIDSGLHLEGESPE
jgi:hypothetical protein